jgi:protein tyrosine phosphatase
MNATYEPGRNLRVTMTNNKVMTGFEVRQFRVEKTSTKSDPVKVKHFLYTAWPDHGVPQYTSSMVKFILDQIKPDMKSNTAPIIVHCSAGAGRTGTFIAIDTTLDRLEEENTINIFECVEIMRTRRTQMVQNVNQYMYAHDAINDHVTCGDTYIVAHELGQKISEMGKKKPGAEMTGFEEQFEILEKLSPEFSEADQNFAFQPKAAGKIRYLDRFTYSENYIETENEEHYVNATHIKGYYGQSGFIAAQAPMKSTIEDTWLVIREQGCTVVVVLCEVFPSEQTSCIHFCPQEPGKTLSTENITVTALKAEETDGYTITEVSSIEEDEEPTITTLYHYKAWKKDGRPDVPSLLKLMGDVQRSHQGSRGPLMVMCDDGMSRTGVFITVMSEIDRVKVEGEMDIFHTVKAARTDRPHMVSTVGDYECCHEILQQYLESFDTYANFK